MANQNNLLEFEEVDTPEEVDRIFRAQRKLSFTYGAVFFAVTLGIPFLSATSESWYGTEIFGGMTLNYLTLAFLYHIFYWCIGLAYTLQANKLEDSLLGQEDDKSSSNNERVVSG